MAKLSEADKRYQKWLAERDARLEAETKEAEPEPKGTTIKVDNGDAVIVIRDFTYKQDTPVIEVAFDASKILRESGLLAIGLSRCCENEEWMNKLLVRTHDWVQEVMREERGKKEM